MITQSEFNRLADEGFNRIPLTAEAFADLETPLSLYLKLARGTGDGRNSFLLESVVGGERFGRYSFIGLPARTVIRVRAHLLTVETDGRVVEEHTLPDPLARATVTANVVFQGKDKIPVNPHTGGNASVSIPSTWGTFEDAADYEDSATL